MAAPNIMVSGEIDVLAGNQTNSTLPGNLFVNGDTKLTGNQVVGGSATILGNATVGGNLTVAGTTTSSLNLVSGDGIQVATGGSNAIAGQVTLVAGQITVLTTSIKADSLIFVSLADFADNNSVVATDSIVPGVSFQIKSQTGTATNKVNWLIVQQG